MSKVIQFVACSQLNGYENRCIIKTELLTMSRHAHALAHTHTHPHKRHPKQQPAHVASFVGLHIVEAKDISARTGIPIEVILAQSALESDWGRTVKGNAYFGIKGKSSEGKSTTFSTHEVTLSGQRVSEVDEFRAYSNYAEAAADYASLIQRRFPAALAFRNDPKKFAEAVARQGYATDPQYAKKIGINYLFTYHTPAWQISN